METGVLLQRIYQWAQRFPDKMCIFEKNNKFTYKQYWNVLCEYGCYLKNRGIVAGDRVAIIAEQSTRFLISVSAVHLVKGIVIPLEKNLAMERVDELVKQLQVRWLICEQGSDIEGVTIIEIDQVNRCAEDYEELITWDCFPEKKSLADILFTTGTTGQPKGIQVTHETNYAIGENVIDSVELQEDDIELVPTPINHSLGLRRYYGAMLRGSTIGIAESVIYADDFFEMLDKYKATAITLVPTMLSILLRFSAERLSKYNKQLRFIQLGSAPILKKDKEYLCNLLPDVRLYNTYGATESGCTCIFDFNKFPDKQFCIGRPTVNTKVKFVDDNGKEIKTSKENVGYMIFEGPMNMSGYWNEPELTGQVLKDGVIYTNDIGYLGEDGFVYLLGRKGDVINSGGNKISPAEIEETALRFDKIEECACVPLADNILGQIPKLFVVMKSGEVYKEQEILEYLSERLEFFKVPKCIEVLNKLPRAYNGKILRKELIEREDEKNG